MDRIELKKWAKEKVAGNRFNIILVTIIVGILTSLAIPIKKGSIPIGWVLYFVQVGYIYYMVNFINDKPRKIEDIFHFSKDFGKDLLTGLVTAIFTFLWTLLFIIPGIIKRYAYSLVPMLLTEDKYKQLDVTEIIKTSQDMMNGHKMDLFVLELSFIGWHLLAILTLGLLEIWIMPYQQTAVTKFLYDVKTGYEANN